MKQTAASSSVRVWLFRTAFVVAFVLWRYASINHFLGAAALCAVLDPARTYVRVYFYLMAIGDEDFLDFVPPASWIVNFAYPLTTFFPQKLQGLENLPKDGKFLLIGNHQTNIADTPFFYAAIYNATGIYVRPLVDNLHNLIPIEKQIVRTMGAIPANPQNCDRAMEAGLTLLIYPGGFIECFRDARVPNYTLMWKDRAGFARMAAKHGYTIVPFASVGFEDMVTQWFTIPCEYFFWMIGDSRSAGNSSKKDQHEVPVAHKFSKGYVAPPFTDCQMPIPAPWTFRPQSNYIVFGKPIDTTRFDATDKEQVFELRDIVRDAVEECIETGKKTQANDPERYTNVLEAIFGKRKADVKKE
ncbi:hypothetical protein HDU98_000286 [Podochytrium sp. JEL0797]|nr:hypothetical protein HDU98_000286 [Podochytrium sp. JEL0797]